MSNKKEREKCKKEFLNSIDWVVDTWDGIDNDLPVAVTGSLGSPPEWWTDMMQLRKKMIEIRKKYR